MILTTTPRVEGRDIIEYKGIVFGEVIGENGGMLMVSISGTAVRLA